MAYTDRFYDDPFGTKRRSAKDDLLKDVEDTFYGGGAAPAPTPTPTPKPTSLAMLGQPTGVLGKRQNAVSRIKRTLPFVDTSTGSQYIGPNGGGLGPQYDDRGYVNPLPRGAVGIQGSQQDKTFNQTLNGSQPTQSTIPTPPRPQTPAELAASMIGENLNKHGSLFGTGQIAEFAPLPSGQSGQINAASRFSSKPFVEGGYQFEAGTLLPEGFQESGGGGLTRQIPQENNQTLHFLPPGFTAATGSTGVPGSTQSDIHFQPPGFSSVTGVVGANKQLQLPQGQQLPQQQTQPIRIQSALDKVREMQGFGSAY